MATRTRAKALSAILFRATAEPTCALHREGETGRWWLLLPPVTSLTGSTG